MRLLLIALLAAGMCTAFSVQPTHIATKDTGSQNLPAMNVDITIDCDTKTLTVTARSNQTGEPVVGARTYLFYTNYAYQVIATGATGEDGTGSMDVIGNRDYLTSLFILRTDHTEFRSREIEFTYQKCFEAPPPGPVRPANQTQPGNTSTPNGNAHNASNETPPQNQTPLANVTKPAGNGHRPSAGPSVPCLPALLVPLLTIFKCIKP
ncbi:MAG: hypothetical protein PHV13_03570 [Candidatus ainarchaeum sp.]|nr:hypothetical protein [Candidatus ainarchaeum sp.]